MDEVSSFAYLELDSTKGELRYKNKYRREISAKIQVERKMEDGRADRQDNVMREAEGVNAWPLLSVQLTSVERCREMKGGKRRPVRVI